MRAGRLRDQVTIEKETRTQNAQGGFTTSWAPLATNSTVWAEIIGLSGDEALRAGVERSVTQFRVTIRKRDDVSAKNRLKWNGQVMAIRSSMPHPKEPNVALLLVCEMGGKP